MNGSQHGDSIVGDDQRNVLFGGGGDDGLLGGDGDELLIGGEGSDFFVGGAGADSFVYMSASEDSDDEQDFSGAEGDLIDLRALALNGGNKSVGELVDALYLALVTGTGLRIDLDGGDGSTATPERWRTTCCC